MKRFLALAALVLGLASCQTEPEGLDVNVGGAVDTTITVSIPDSETRANSAVGAFQNVDWEQYTIRYIFQVFYGEDESKAARQVIYTDNDEVSFPVRLVPNRHYNFVVWADVVPAEGKTPNTIFELTKEEAAAADYHYNTLNLKDITIIDVENNHEWEEMDETRDAFTGQYDTAVDGDGTPYTGAKNISFTLTRPFAKLRVITTDMKQLNDLVIAPTTAEVEYTTDLFASFNAFAGTVNKNAKLNKTHQNFDIKTYEDNNDKSMVLFTDYLFAADQDEEVNFTLSVYDQYETIIGKTINFNTAIPARRNYLTTISGNILTDGNNIKVEVKDAFDNKGGQGEWNPGEDMYDVEVWDGESMVAPALLDENNDNIYEIERPSELAWLAAAVNGTLPEELLPAEFATRANAEAMDFAGKTFKLTQDIDLGGNEWTPIGSSDHIFKGTFDGNGKKIANLLITGNNSNVGLFGVTHDGEIKNFTLINAKVSGRLNVGTVAGQPYTSKYTNITVTGHVEVNGMAYVGGVGGKNAYADWTNIKVEADDTSYVKANSVENGTAYRTYVGGVCGFNGEGGHKFSNITSNINVEGSTCDVGGLFGIAHYNNVFENCTCTGDVTIYAAEEADEAQQIGGIAGVWHNETGCSVTMTDCSFEGTLTTNIEGVNFYYGGLVGAPYSSTGTGKLIIGGKQYVATAAQLQAAVEAATGETTIYLGYDIVGNVTVVQKQGVKITIDGENRKLNGSIKVHSNSNYYADAALTIKNVNFETSAADFNVIEALENGSARYSTNITVENCTFTATGEAVNTSVGVQIKSTKNAKVLNCTATDMHSLLQAQSCDETVVVNGCTIDGKNGVAFKQVKAATVEGTTITAAEYGIRFDGNIDNYGIVVKNNNVTAVQPFIVRKMTGKDNTITLEGTNTLTTEAEYQIVITNGSDDEAYVKPTGTYTLTGADNYTIFPAPYPVASWDEFTAALAAGETDIKLTADITYDANYQLQKSVILNLGGYSMTLPMINIHTKTTIKNGTINGKVYARKNSEIVFNNVKFSGAVADNLSTEGHLAIQGGCKSLYAKDCLFSPTSVSGSQTKPLSFEGGSTIMKFEGCEFKSSPYKKQVYLNSLSATGSLEFINCNFNNKTPNIMFAAACPLTNLKMSGTTKLSSVSLETNRAKDAVTAEDLAYLRESLIANNSMSSVRLFYADGSSEYIR